VQRYEKREDKKLLIKQAKKNGLINRAGYCIGKSSAAAHQKLNSHFLECCTFIYSNY
jgi:hypothetical protein